MKPCLKLTSRSSSPCSGGESGCSTPTRKCVAFGEEGSEQVFTADEWDRTPTEPARRLSYQDMLELKEIQRSLPRANQLADPISGRAPSHYLSAVPIGLLPLLPESPSIPSAPPSTPTLGTECTTPKPSTASKYPLRPDLRPWKPPPPPQYGLLQHLQQQQPRRQSPPRAPALASGPAHLAHLLPARPSPQRAKPRFTFLPLLDSPTSPPAEDPDVDADESRSSTPEPAPGSTYGSTYASSISSADDTDASQPSTPSLTSTSSTTSCSPSRSPSPPFLQLSPHSTGKHRGSHPEAGDFFPLHTNTNIAERDLETDGGYFSSTFGDEPRHYRGFGGHTVMSSSVHMRLSAVPSPTLVPPSPLVLPGSCVPTYIAGGQQQHLARCEQGSGSGQAQKPKKKRNVIVVNDMEIELDGDDDDEVEEEEEIVGAVDVQAYACSCLAEQEQGGKKGGEGAEDAQEPRRVLHPEGESIQGGLLPSLSRLHDDNTLKISGSENPVSPVLSTPTASTSTASTPTTATPTLLSPVASTPTSSTPTPYTPPEPGLHAPIRFKRAVPPPLPTISSPPRAPFGSPTLNRVMHAPSSPSITPSPPSAPPTSTGTPIPTPNPTPTSPSSPIRIPPPSSGAMYVPSPSRGSPTTYQFSPLSCSPQYSPTRGRLPASPSRSPVLVPSA